jgi:hypothetical protein
MFITAKNISTKVVKKNEAYILCPILFLNKGNA